MSALQNLPLPCLPVEVDAFLSQPSQAVTASLGRSRGNFLVLGAGGKMGLHVCLMLRRALDQAGSSQVVTAISRFSRAEDRAQFEGAGIRTLPCDLSEPAALAGLAREENVIFMAGAKFGTADRPELLHRMNVEMPAQVARHFANSRITAFSTGCVYTFAPVTSAGSTENSPTEPVGAYAQSCLGREQAFREVAERHGTPLALIRLNYSVEFRYGVLVDLARRILADQAVDVSTGHVNVIWQRDAVAHALQAHELASAQPFILNVTGPEVLSVRALAVRLGHYLGRSPQFMGEEAETAWLNDASRAHELFGRPETTLEQMLEWVAAWQVAGLPILGKPTGFEKRDGNF